MKNYHAAVCAVVFAGAAFWMTGCAGPSTRVLPRQQIVSGQEVPEALPVLEAANPFYIQESLLYITSDSRMPESHGERRTGEYLARMLENYGYRVETSHHTVTAVREAEDEDADLLIAFTSYGTAQDSAGTLESAAGTAVLLESARLLASAPTDSELRFVFFPEEPDALAPVHDYVESLSSQEKARVIGALQAGPQGYAEGGTLVLATADGSPTLFAEQMNKSVMQLTGHTLDYTQRAMTGVNVFTRNQIPAVALVLDRDVRRMGTCFDREELVDTDVLAENADIVTQTLYSFMDPDSPSMKAKSRFYNDIRDDAFVQPADAVLPFGQPRESLERQTGQSGVLVSENEDAEGHFIEAYQYPMKWFGVDQVILTRYYYYDGLLKEVEVDADGSGVDYDDAIERITSVYGEYTGFENTPSGAAYDWINEQKRLSVELDPGRDGYELVISECDTPRMALDPDTPAAQMLYHLAEKILPSDIRFFVYTDGIGATKGYVEQQTEEDPETGEEVQWYAVGLDPYDALTEENHWQNCMPGC
jgi:aminopeptidase YwaD